MNGKPTKRMLEYARDLAQALGWRKPGKDASYEEVAAFIERAKAALESPVGVCGCGEPVRFRGQKWVCDGGHAVWLTYLDARFSEAEALALLNGEEVVKRNLKGKNGKPFAARLAFDPDVGRVKIAEFLPHEAAGDSV